MSNCNKNGHRVARLSPRLLRASQHANAFRRACLPLSVCRARATVATRPARLLAAKLVRSPRHFAALPRALFSFLRALSASALPRMLAVQTGRARCGRSRVDRSAGSPWWWWCDRVLHKGCITIRRAEGVGDARPSCSTACGHCTGGVRGCRCRGRACSAGRSEYAQRGLRQHADVAVWEMAV